MSFIESPAPTSFQREILVQSPEGPSCVKTSPGRSKGLEFTTSGRVSSLESQGSGLMGVMEEGRVSERLCIMLNVSRGMSLQNLILVY